MQLTQFTDFGLRVLMYLTQVDKEQLVTINEICEQFNLPRNHLIKVVNKLVKLGWVDAVRGRNGGLRLAINPTELGLGQAIRELEETKHLIDCGKKQCVLMSHCHLKGFLDDGLEQFYQLLDQKTLADSVAKPTGESIMRMHKHFQVKHSA